LRNFLQQLSERDDGRLARPRFSRGTGVFAHHELGISVNDLFGGTLVGDIEDILHDLNRIRTAVFQLLENGRQQWLADDDRTYVDPFIADTRNALSPSLRHCNRIAQLWVTDWRSGLRVEAP
jgi:hypothetical protein